MLYKARISYYWQALISFHVLWKLSLSILQRSVLFGVLWFKVDKSVARNVVYYFSTLCVLYICVGCYVWCDVAPAARVELCHFPSASQWAQWIFIPTTLASGNQLHTTSPHHPHHPHHSSISERKTVYFQLFKWLSFLNSMILLKVFVAFM